jgi:hypothetical protein
MTRAMGIRWVVAFAVGAATHAVGGWLAVALWAALSLACVPWLDGGS